MEVANTADLWNRDTLMRPITPLLPLALSFALPCVGRDFPIAAAPDLKAALSHAQPGDTLTLAEGEWRDADLVFEATGTPGKPITLQAEKAGKTILTGQSRLRIGGQHLVVSGLFFRGASPKDQLVEFRRDSKRLATDCRLTECALVGCNSPEGADSHWLGMYGQRNRVDHCWIEGKTTRGTTLVVWLGEDEPAEHRIDHNYFGPRPPLKKNGGETIRVGDSKTSMKWSRTIVEANCFQGCDGEAEIISNKSCGNIYRGNTFLRCAGALTLRHGNDCLVQGNYFLGANAKETGGVRIIGERHRVEGNYFQDLTGKEARAGLCLVNGLGNAVLSGYFQVIDARITGNTWVDCRQPVYIGQTDPDSGNAVPAKGVVFARNLISGKTPAVTIHTPGEVKWEDNAVNAAAAPTPAIKGLRIMEFELSPDAAGLHLPATGSPAAGYGYAGGQDAAGPLTPLQTGPGWRDADARKP